MAWRRGSVLVVALAFLGAAACGSFSSPSDPVPLADAATSDATSDASVSGDSGDASLDAGGPRYRIFQTSETFAGDLGGIAGADVRCTKAAQSFDAGKVVALLAAAGASPFESLAEGQYVNTHGDTVFGTRPKPKSVYLNEIRDELGLTRTANVWTGGTGSDCEGWMTNDPAKQGSFGTIGALFDPTSWFVADSVNCAGPAALYCVEQP